MISLCSCSDWAAEGYIGVYIVEGEERNATPAIYMGLPSLNLRKYDIGIIKSDCGHYHSQ